MNIIRKAKISANKRSVDAYGRSVELAIANYLLKGGKYPTGINNLEIEYKGQNVVCDIMNLQIDGSGSCYSTSVYYYPKYLNPVLYLKSSVKIESGEGSESNPYILSM